VKIFSWYARKNNQHEKKNREEWEKMSQRTGRKQAAYDSI
jgi:hypothetical protein